MVNRCLDLMGSYGYSREGKMQKLLRDLKITQIVVGGQMLRLTELARTTSAPKPSDPWRRPAGGSPTASRRPGPPTRIRR